MSKKVITFIVAIIISKTIWSQGKSNPITTATPFLLVTTDARAGGMGEIGVATSSDAFSIFHNPAKIAFNENSSSFGINYSPWLRNLTNDIFVGNFSYTNRFSNNAGWGFDVKYFSLGEIELRSSNNIKEGYKNPNEFALTGVYAMKLSNSYSMGIGLKYLQSNLDVSNNLHVINSFAVDVSGYYESQEKNYGSFNGKYRLGFNISNLGPKVEYTPGGTENFIPTNLKFGGGFDFIIDNRNHLNINAEFNKLLVPTPPIRERGDENGNGIANEIKKGNDDTNTNPISGIFTSFSDAPNGFSEEIKEFTWALGAEYTYNNSFSVRGGYFHESELKGNKQFFTLGAGFKTKSLIIDLSYLVNTSDINNPLENTLRFSLGFELGKKYND